LVDDWMLAELADAVTGEVFRIADFYGRPVLVESFAVWCPICLRQQREMAELLESAGEAIVHVSLDTDPNEDLDAVRAHMQQHGFDWWFAVAPLPVTQALISEFGLSVVNAPGAPVVLVGPHGSSRLLPRGVKTAEELLEAVEEGAG
jgi:thiol-disulfide isomerase/thioredoxin